MARPMLTQGHQEGWWWRRGLGEAALTGSSSQGALCTLPEAAKRWGRLLPIIPLSKLGKLFSPVPIWVEQAEVLPPLQLCWLPMLRAGHRWRVSFVSPTFSLAYCEHRLYGKTGSHRLRIKFGYTKGLVPENYNLCGH